METFVVAGCAFAVALPDGFVAWEEIAPRYRKFAAESSAPMLEIDVTVARLSVSEGEKIYEPEYHGLSSIVSSVWRLADGRVAVEFRHIDEAQPRLRMAMSEAMDRAAIAIAPAGDECDAYFLNHALMIAYMLGTVGSGTLLFHSSVVIHEGRAYLFQGKSGTGKSTHASLWIKNVPGARLLNDDHPVISFGADGVPVAYGSPWSGKTPCYHNHSAPIGAIVRIVRDSCNRLDAPLPPMMAYASLTTSAFSLPFLSEAQQAARHAAIERLACAVPCCNMHCLPEADAAITCRRQLGEILTR